MSLIQLLRLRTWETRLSKMPHLETPCLEMGTRIKVAFLGNITQTENLNTNWSMKTLNVNSNPIFL